MSVTSSQSRFLINLSSVRANYLAFSDAIHQYQRNDIIAYSVKANYDSKIMQTLASLGSYMEVCSEFEYNQAIEYVKSPRNIIINGFHVEPDLLLQHIKLGSLVILNSIDELKYLTEINIPVRIGIRLNLDYIKNGELYFSHFSRFGISPSAPELLKILTNSNIQIICLHCHFSGNSRSPEIYYNIVQELCRIISSHRMKDVQMLDIGGGYKVGPTFWTFDDYVNKVNMALYKAHQEHLRVIYEPGNSIVRNTCSYHTFVIAIAQHNGIRDIVISGTKYHCGQGRRNLENFIRFANSPIRPLCHEVQRITGCTCKESDILCELTHFPYLEIGDELVIDELGAYTMDEIPQFLLPAPNRDYLP